MPRLRPDAAPHPEMSSAGIEMLIAGTNLFAVGYGPGGGRETDQANQRNCSTGAFSTQRGARAI